MRLEFADGFSHEEYQQAVVLAGLRAGRGTNDSFTGARYTASGARLYFTIKTSGHAHIYQSMRTDAGGWEAPGSAESAFTAFDKLPHPANATAAVTIVSRAAATRGSPGWNRRKTSPLSNPVAG